ncbi:MAG TPA: polymer-forming cytoskeletal protein, partial [Rhodocyclaceae bacterium]|nr:polymer-forming cytoskeletal protein [Rhodocyclaceae bacterium]
MFNKPSSLAMSQENLADRKSPSSPRTVVHTPGGFPPLRNEPAPIVHANAHANTPASKIVEPAPRTAAVEEPTPTATTADQADTIGSSLIVGPDVKLKGAEILDCDTLVVEGRVEATMDSRVIRITERGAFSGKVGIDVAEVYGQFEGELIARQQLIIHATGRVKGKIRYGKLLIEAGGTISGEIESIAEAKMAEVRTQTVDTSKSTGVKPV